MNELLLKYAWKFGRFNTADLYTNRGEKVEIIHPGRENFDAGPDFFLAKVRLDDTFWVGNIEIHTRAGDWQRHGHGSDRAYDNVVLHVVYENDLPVSHNEREVPAIELKDRLDASFVDNYERISKPYQHIPCEQLHAGVDPFHKSAFLSRLLIERLSEKCRKTDALLELNKGDLSETFYQLLFAGFGGPVNRDAFELLSRHLPYRIICKYAQDREMLEALLFRVAGLLEEDVDDPAVKALREKTTFPVHKHKLVPLRASQWKFMRMRPANFPTLRLSQLANLLHHCRDLSFFYKGIQPEQQYRRILTLQASSFWNKHYTFGTSSHEKVKFTGQDFVTSLLINVIYPFVFYYARRTGDHCMETLEQAYRRLLPENNRIVRLMTAAGFDNPDASSSQALLQLYSTYCEPKKCLNCAIGYQVLR